MDQITSLDTAIDFYPEADPWLSEWHHSVHLSEEKIWKSFSTSPPFSPSHIHSSCSYLNGLYKMQIFIYVPPLLKTFNVPAVLTIKTYLPSIDFQGSLYLPPHFPLGSPLFAKSISPSPAMTLAQLLWHPPGTRTSFGPLNLKCSFALSSLASSCCPIRPLIWWLPPRSPTGPHNTIL